MPRTPGNQAAAPPPDLSAVDWSLLVRTAMRHGLAPLTYGALKHLALTDRLPADALRRLDIDTVIFNASDQQVQAAALIRGSSDWRVLYDSAGALVAERTIP